MGRMDASPLLDPGALQLVALALLGGPLSAAVAPVLALAALVAVAL